MKLLKTVNPKLIKTLCNLSLKKSLYVKGRLGKDWMSVPTKMIGFATAFKKHFSSEDIIANCFIYRPEEYIIPNPAVLSVFVNPEFRLKKVGSSLIRFLIEDFYEPLIVDDRSNSFFNKIPELVSIVNSKEDLSFKKDLFLGQKMKVISL